MRLAAVLVILVQFAGAQSPQVPHKLNFAGITLTIRDDARREIQKDVDALTQYPRYFTIKVERAKTYFPVIEKIFAEERLPDDFKYLVLQESALIADAVSVSDAVGFWQFKDFTAIEMGLRVDKEIDERMNIAASSRAAAQYLKKNNHYFNNWVYALQAYQMGAGGVMRSVHDFDSGTKHMEINSQTYWYVKKFLAHMIAFEHAVKGPGSVNLLELENQGKKTLHQLAKEFSVDQNLLEEYNKWVRKGTIPDDRKYIVAIPVQGDARNVFAAVNQANTKSIQETNHPKRLEVKPAVASQNITKYIHGLPAIKAEAGENSATLSKRAGVGLSFFLSCNDLSISDPLKEGLYYYLKKKKSRAQVPQHIVRKENETLWSVSQQYGVQLRKIKKLNPSVSPSDLRPGTIVELPASTIKVAKINEAQNEIVEVESGNYFNWTVDPKSESAGIDMDFKGRIEIKPTELVSAQPVSQPASQAESSPVSQPATEQALSIPNQHVVSAGETLYSISKRYQVGVMDLVNWNQLKIEEGIKPGQVLTLKQAQSMQSTHSDKFIVYEVKNSDTLYSVARQYGVTIKEIMDWNKKTDFNVTTGEKLRIQQR